MNEVRTFTNTLMRQIDDLNTNAGCPMTTAEKTSALRIIESAQVVLEENRVDIKWVNWRKSNFKMNVFNFALLGLNKDDHDFYIVPRKDGKMQPDKNGNMFQPYTMTLDLQYQGEEKIIMRYCKKPNGAKVSNILKNVVCEGERFETSFDFATGKTVIKAHEVKDVLARDKTERGIRGAYAIVYFDDGSNITVVIDKARIARAKQAAMTKNIWNSDYEKMVLKTVVHDLYKECAKYINTSTEINNAIRDIEKHNDSQEKEEHMETVDVSYEIKDEPEHEQEKIEAREPVSQETHETAEPPKEEKEKSWML
jgi:recombinational DNA repair protein RecT